jgi:uracil-DNA glycosylase
MTSNLNSLLVEIRKCRECEAHLPLGPRPILAAHQNARILIIGQAPGIRVHESGVPWDDPSGERLREWMGISTADFYDAKKVAIVPMGFCYPGKGKTGDLPPRKECAQLWHDRLLDELKKVKFTLVIGRYAQAYRLGEQNKSTLTKTVAAWQEFTPSCLPLPHPSPLNNRWLKKNAWFEKDVVPYLKRRTKRLLS